MIKKSKLVRVYLASPYSHRDPVVVTSRYVTAVYATAALQTAYPTHNIFSPIVNSHPLADMGKLRGDWQFWKALDTDHIENNHEIWVLEIPGWRESTGVTEEILIGKSLAMPIRYVSGSATTGIYTVGRVPLT